MKKCMLTLMCVMIIIITSCSEDIPNLGGDNNPTDTSGTVKYVASVSDPVNYKIRVEYIDENGIDAGLHKIVVESPFVYSFKVNSLYSTFCYLSVSAEQRNPVYDDVSNVHAKLHIDDKLVEEDINNFFSLITYTFGQN